MKRTWVPITVAAATLGLLIVGSVSGHAERLASKLREATAPAPATLTESESPAAVEAAPQAADAPAYKNEPASDQQDLIDLDKMSAMGSLARKAATGRLGRALARARAQREAALKGVRPLLKDPGDDGGDDDDLDNPAGGQAETTIAVDATGMHIVVGINDTRGFSLNPTSVSGFQYSDDGGVTFVDGGQLPSTPTGQLSNGTLLPQVFGDPEIKYIPGGGGCQFVYFSIGVIPFGTPGAGSPPVYPSSAQTMVVHRSTDCGHTWAGPFEIPSATNPHGAVTSGGAPRDAADKEFADFDPDTGRVMMAWNNFTFTSPTQEISSTYSDNIMTATPPTWSPRVIISRVSGDQNAVTPRFAGGGSSNVYATWPRAVSGTQLAVHFARSTDNGATWSAPFRVSDPAFIIDQILGNDRAHQFPALAVDNSGGPHQGSVYFDFASNNNHDGSDIVFQRSIDGGLTWSAGVLLNSRPGNDRAQWYPGMTVDQNTGRLYTFYYDQGIAANGDLSETTYLFSDDGGVTWSKPMPLTDRPFHAGWGNDTGQPNLGDYNEAVAQNGELFVVWAGTELKGFADGQPSTSMTTPDVFFKRSPAVKVSVDLGAVTFVDGSGNGFIDPGETVSFTMPLRNYDTNSLHAGSITGITGTLSTTTPGVTVTTANSAYPDLAPGASAPNTTAYVIKTSPSFVPGTHIELSLAVSSAQGTNTLLFTQATGTPNPTVLLSENFNGVAAGTLPAGWSTLHGGGNNTVPWTTNGTLFGTTSNAAFHINANDGTSGQNARFERLLSPTFTVPANSEYVTVDMDVAYDTEDEPLLNIYAYDGFLVRVTDFTAGRTLRSVLAEAFEEELFTDSFQHYPKHFPRGSIGGRYLEDMSAWAGFSNGFQHVHMKFPGMAGSTAQLRFEFTQDSAGTCADVRPGHSCGVMFDNLVIRSVTSSALSPAQVWIGLKNSDDVGTRFDLKAEIFKNGTPIGSGEIDNVSGGSSGFNNAILRSIALGLSASSLTVQSGDTVSIKLSVRAGATGHVSGTARLWYNDSAANSHFDMEIGGVTTNLYLLDGFALGTSPGPGPKKTIDVLVSRNGGNPFKPFGTWSKAF